MGAVVFHGRVRDGIGCINHAMATGPPGRSLGNDECVWLDAVRRCARWPAYADPRLALVVRSIGLLGPLG